MSGGNDDPLSWGQATNVSTYASLGPAPPPHSVFSNDSMIDLDLGPVGPSATTEQGTAHYPALPISQSEHHPPPHTQGTAAVSNLSGPAFGSADVLAAPAAQGWDIPHTQQQSQSHASSAYPTVPSASAHPASGWAAPQPTARPNTAAPDPPLPIVVTVGPAVKVAGSTGSINLPGVDPSHWEFPVTTQTSLASWPEPQVQVQRRFRDFVALADVLAATLPGYFLPQRPHRNAVQTHRGSPRFLDKRRAALERYLTRLVSHPVVRASAPLQVFLQASGSLESSPAWSALQPPSNGFIKSTKKLFRQMTGSESATPSVKDVTRSARQSGDVLRLLREQVAALQGVVKGAPVTPVEARLRDVSTQLEEEKRALSALSGAAHTLVARCAAQAHGWQDTAKALHTLALFEGTYGYTTGACESRCAEGAGRAGEVGLLCSDHLGQVANTLQEEGEAVPLAQAALLTRERALLTQLTLEHTLHRKHQALDAANAAGPAAFQKAQTLTNTCLDLQAALGAAREEYTRLCERNSEELVVWRAQRQREMVAAVKDLANVQAKANERFAQLWKETADNIGNVRM